MSNGSIWKKSKAFLTQRPALLLGLILLLGLLIRLPYTNNDITEFPQDRNHVGGSFIMAQQRAIDWSQPKKALAQLFVFIPYLPEFQFIPDASYFLSRLGIPHILAARLFNLAFNLIGAWGLYLIGKVWLNQRVGLLAALAYMLMPMSVLVGRSILPENLTNTFLIWGVAFALGVPRLSWRANAAGLIPTLMLLIPAKLIFVLFWPLPLLLYGWRQRHTPRRTLIVMLLATVGTYLVTCLHYRLNLLNPFPELLQIRASYRHLTATSDELLSGRAVWITINRVILALTLPGCLLVLCELGRLGARAKNHLWMIAWALLSVAYIWINVKANTYWAFAATAPGCLLVASMLVNYAFKSKSAFACGAIFLLIGLKLCPGEAKIRGYLCGDQSYQEAATFKSQMATPVIYRRAPSKISLEHYMGVDGIDFDKQEPRALLMQIARGEIKRYLTVLHSMDGFDLEVFRHRAVLVHTPQRATLYDTSLEGNIGTIVTGAVPAEPGMPLPLGTNLRLLHYAYIPAAGEAPTPGKALTLELMWELIGKAADGDLILNLRHEKSGISLPLIPKSRAVQIPKGSQALVQLPTFGLAKREQVRSQFILPPGMPCGDYRVELLLVPQGNYTESEKKAIARLVLPAALPLKQLAKQDEPEQRSFGADQLVWVNPDVCLDLKLLTPSVIRPCLRGTAAAYLGAGLPAGDYDVTLDGVATGCGPDEQTYWPQIGIGQTLRSGARQTMRYKGLPFENHTIRIHWEGPEDALVMQLTNATYQAGDLFFFLYLHDLSGGIRSWLPQRIVFKRVKS